MNPLSISRIGLDPNTTHRLNANSFQQDALIYYKGWQYCAYYSVRNECDDANRHISVARRKVLEGDGQWEVITLTNYVQTADDGHNTISMGICPLDGTIHLSFDQHCDQLKYSMSQPDIANQPDAFEWKGSLFGPVLHDLPGVDPADLCEVTYPRFLVAHDHLLFECRIGMAGEGSDVLYRYEPRLNRFNFIATYLRGIKNNPYIHGLSFEPDRSRIHVSWMYREYVYVDKSTSAHRQQAGPNGPENNRDLAYAYSDDYGETWHNSEGVSLGAGSITPHSPGIVVHRMPCGSGLLNSEGQCVDRDGNFHILSRDGIRTGKLEWQHIMRDARTGIWTTETIPTLEPTSIGRRGKICSDPITGNIFFIVPGNKDDSLTILVRERIPGQGSTSFTEIHPWYSLAGMDGEPLVDEQRLLAGNGVLSIFTRTADAPRSVVVVDFRVSDPPAESTGPP